MFHAVVPARLPPALLSFALVLTLACRFTFSCSFAYPRWSAYS
jgi:hypothetical protein